MNNNDVIEYIRVNSKHPHAALMVEWLLTGCEVKVYYDDLEQYVICENPTWRSECDYLLSQPKPVCRVYLRTTGYPATVERFPDGTYSENYNENLEWISDWIEYDPEPTRKWPNEYIKRIAEIDQSAAQWIVDNINEDNWNNLLFMFVWRETQQGHEYWQNIYQTLNASKLASS
jgi:hypothetical protein